MRTNFFYGFTFMIPQVKESSLQRGHIIVDIPDDVFTNIHKNASKKKKDGQEALSIAYFQRIDNYGYAPVLSLMLPTGSG